MFTFYIKNHEPFGSLTKNCQKLDKNKSIVSRFSVFVVYKSAVSTVQKSNFTLYNVCAVPWGVLSTVGAVQYRGGYHEYRGGYLEYRGVFSTVGGIMINGGGYLEYRGGCSVPWGDIMSTVGVILVTVGDVQYRGGYHDACGGYHEYRGGCSVPWGDTIL